MLLILEIILTVKSWRKGWKAVALIPGALALFIGFMVGASAPHGDSDGILFGIGLIIDLVTIAVLGVMAANAPQGATPAAPAAPVSKNTECATHRPTPNIGTETPALPAFAKRA